MVDDYVSAQAATLRTRRKAVTSLKSLTWSQDDLRTARSTVQEKLSAARKLLSTLTAQEKARLAAIEKQKQQEAARGGLGSPCWSGLRRIKIQCAWAGSHSYTRASSWRGR